MFGLQRVSGGCVLLKAKSCGLESIYAVTGGALSSVGSLGELAHVGIFVTIRTFGERDGLLEVSGGMALHALYAGVFALQRVFRSGVVERLADGGCRHPLPPRSVVTGLATLREASVVRIGMAVRTLAEGNPGVARLIVRARRVALLAAYIRVHSGERIARVRVVEFLYVNRFPVAVGVTLQAVGSQAPLVLVFVTGRARLR